jgi:hypothetical protein
MSRAGPKRLPAIFSLHLLKPHRQIVQPQISGLTDCTYLSPFASDF